MQKIAVLGVGRDINLDKSSDACRIVAQVVSDNGAFLSILSWFVGMPDVSVLCVSFRCHIRVVNHTPSYQ